MRPWRPFLFELDSCCVRRVGYESGKFEVITAVNSFHGRTLAGIAATGQDKIKKGFGPAVEASVRCTVACCSTGRT